MPDAAGAKIQSLNPIAPAAADASPLHAAPVDFPVRPAGSHATSFGLPVRPSALRATSFGLPVRPSAFPASSSPIGGQGPFGAGHSLGRRPAQPFGTLAADGLCLILLAGALGLLWAVLLGAGLLIETVKGFFG